MILRSKQVRRVHSCMNIIFHFFLRLTSILFFIASLLKIRFSVPVERVESATSNPRVGSLKVGLKIAVSTRSTVTSNQILKRVAIKNNMHYSKQNKTESTTVNAACASMGSILQNLCKRCNVSLLVQLLNYKLGGLIQICDAAGGIIQIEFICD